MKLSDHHKYALKLIRKDADKDGWASVSKLLWPVISLIPTDLAEREFFEETGAGRIRLTDRGNAVVDYLI